MVAAVLGAAGCGGGGAGSALSSAGVTTLPERPTTTTPVTTATYTSGYTSYYRTHSGTAVFFSAATPLTGRELWAIEYYQVYLPLMER